MKKLSFDDFSSLLMGGPSRYSEKGISYVLIEEGEEEVFYAEVDNEQLREAYEAYMEGESTYRG